MKDYLEKLFEEHKNQFAILKEEANKVAVTEKWGYGVMPPFSLLPFYSEILGNKPGRFLKKESLPGKNKYCYLLDAENRIVNSIEYAKFSEFNNQWIVYNKFYFHDSESIIEYSFGSALENDTIVNLDSVKLVQLSEGRITKGYTLIISDAYEEFEYHYEDDRINFVETKIWWPETYFERNYKVTYNDNVLIEEVLNNGKTVKIFPYYYDFCKLFTIK